MGPPKTLLDVLEDRILIDDGCWQWTGATNKGGYGSLRWEGRFPYAHRVVYELLVGPIPKGMQLDHLCRNRACVRPDHLEPVTCRENVLRGDGIAANNARKTHCPQGHEYTEENTYVNHGRRFCRMCGRDHFNRWYRRKKG